MAIIQIDTTHAHTKSLSQVLSEKYLEASDYKNNEEILHIFFTESSMSLTKKANPQRQTQNSIQDTDQNTRKQMDRDMFKQHKHIYAQIYTRHAGVVQICRK